MYACVYLYYAGVCTQLCMQNVNIGYFNRAYNLMYRMLPGVFHYLLPSVSSHPLQADIAHPPTYRMCKSFTILTIFHGQLGTLCNSVEG